METPILHHYPQSPVAEKVRIVLGIKSLKWHSVIIPRIPPKPDLMPLTGGYRQTPVMQIGADIYCDSQCIIRELERRYPQPTLFPGGSQGMAWGVSQWTDGPLFKTTIAVIFANPSEDMPEHFVADRLPLYFHSHVTLASLKESLADNLANLRAQIGWMDDRLTQRKFMLGTEPGLPDAVSYYLIWFIHGRYRKGNEFLAEFKHVCRWQKDMAAIGHGSSVDMSAEEALAAALATESDSSNVIDPLDAQGLTADQKVQVIADNQCSRITGTLRSITRDEIVINYQHPRVGNVAIHFPRAGFHLRTL